MTVLMQAARPVLRKDNVSSAGLEPTKNAIGHQAASRLSTWTSISVTWKYGTLQHRHRKQVRPLVIQANGQSAAEVDPEQAPISVCAATYRTYPSGPSAQTEGIESTPNHNYDS